MDEIIKGFKRDEYIYHETVRSSIKGIEKNGFSPDNRSELNDEKYLRMVENQFNLDIPVERSKASFFYPTYQQLKNRKTSNYAVIIDFTKINDGVYIADMKYYNQIINNAPYIDTTDKLTKNQAGYGIKYINSIKYVKNINDLHSISSSMDIPEIMVDSNIPKSAIIGYIHI